VDEQPNLFDHTAPCPKVDADGEECTCPPPNPLAEIEDREMQMARELGLSQAAYPGPFDESEDPDDHDDDPEDSCVRCGKPLPVEGFCCEPECLAAAAGELTDEEIAQRVHQLQANLEDEKWVGENYYNIVDEKSLDTFKRWVRDLLQ